MLQTVSKKKVLRPYHQANLANWIQSVNWICWSDDPTRIAIFASRRVPLEVQRATRRYRFASTGSTISNCCSQSLIAIRYWLRRLESRNLLSRTVNDIRSFDHYLKQANGRGASFSCFLLSFWFFTVFLICCLRQTLRYAPRSLITTNRAEQRRTGTGFRPNVYLPGTLVLWVALRSATSLSYYELNSMKLLLHWPQCTFPYSTLCNAHRTQLPIRFVAADRICQTALHLLGVMFEPRSLSY